MTGGLGCHQGAVDKLGELGRVGPGARGGRGSASWRNGPSSPVSRSDTWWTTSKNTATSNGGPIPPTGAPPLVCFTDRGWDEADACARIVDDLDQELASRVGADKIHQLQELLAEVTNVLRDTT